MQRVKTGVHLHKRLSRANLSCENPHVALCVVIEVVSRRKFMINNSSLRFIPDLNVDSYPRNEPKKFTNQSKELQQNTRKPHQHTPHKYNNETTHRGRNQSIFQKAFGVVCNSVQLIVSFAHPCNLALDVTSSFSLIEKMNHTAFDCTEIECFM